MSRFPRPDYRALTRYAPDRRAAPVDLSDNTNLWGAHPAARRALARLADDDLRRYPDVYGETLRSAIGRRFGVDAACVVTGCGSDDLLDSVFRAAGPGGGCVAYVEPTFSMVETFARMNGMRPAPAARDEALADPARLLDDQPDVIYVCRPNNPTGELQPAAWVDALLDAAGGDGPLVVLDEAYADFAGESLLARAAGSPRLVVVRTLSKAFGLAGLRVGFTVSTPDVAAEVEKSRGPYKVTRPSEAGAVAALEAGTAWTERVIAETRRNRERLSEALARRGTPALPSAANFVLVPVPDAAELARILRERGVAVRPFPGLPEIGDAVRISVGPWPLLERLLEAWPWT
ncbi:MAG: histidinol-phosphate aminotransferase family protein [Gemmatimonadetes bacterium]|nr:MAG: histidinol-phosphate aminotransferase family protein [Gemmatimonadota bacterium]